jgi:hypothetical protein
MMPDVAGRREYFTGFRQEFLWDWIGKFPIKERLGIAGPLLDLDLRFREIVVEQQLLPRPTSQNDLHYPTAPFSIIGKIRWLPIGRNFTP